MNNETKHVNLAHARAKHQKDTMEQIKQDDVCPFCRENFETYHTKPIIRETDHWILTENFAPYEGTDKHFIFVAKQHCTTADELSPEAWGDLQSMLEYACTHYNIPGSSFIMRTGDTDYTGASVTHLHAQLIAGGKRNENSEPIFTVLGYKAPSTEQG